MFAHHSGYPGAHSHGGARHPGDRIGRVVSAMSGAAADGAKKSMAGPTGGGGGKVEAQWVFAGMMPGWTLTGGGRQGEGKKDLSHLGPITPLKKFILPDPPESKAIKAALAETPGKGAALRVTAVSGSVQKLTVQGGQQGWAPLESGDTIAPSAIIRVDNHTGGMVQVGSAFKQAGQQKWEKIHEDTNHTVHVLKGK